MRSGTKRKEKLSLRASKPDLFFESSARAFVLVRKGREKKERRRPESIVCATAQEKKEPQKVRSVDRSRLTEGGEEGERRRDWGQKTNEGEREKDRKQEKKKTIRRNEGRPWRRFHERRGRTEKTEKTLARSTLDLLWGRKSMKTTFWVIDGLF